MAPLRKISPERTLATRRPDLALQWSHRNEQKPDQVAASSGIKFWWVCESGHEWEASPHSRNTHKSGCPVCRDAMRPEISRKTLFDPKRTVAKLRPDLVPEWHETNSLKPDEVTVASGIKILWRCPKGHEWTATVANRAQNDSGCPICSKENMGEIQRLSAVKRRGESLERLFPEIAAQWDNERNSFLPSEVTPASNQNVWWKCNFGHSWRAKVFARTNRNSGCPHCSGAQTSKIEIYLYCELKHIFEQVLYRKKVEGYEVDIQIPSIKVAIELDGSYWHEAKTKKDRAKNKIIANAGLQLIRVRHVELVPLSADEIVYKDSEPSFVIMKRLATFLQRDHDCSALRQYIKADKPQNEVEFREILSRIPGPPPGESLADLFPQIAEQWDYEANAPLIPELFTPGSSQKVHWVCQQGHRYKSQISGRTKQNRACLECYRENIGDIFRVKRLKPGNSLAERRPDLLELWDYDQNKTFFPDAVAAKSNYKVWWKCPEGHPPYQQIIGDKVKGNGCPLCKTDRLAASRRRSTIKKYGSIAKRLERSKFTLIETGKTPEAVAATSTISLRFRCDRGHEFKAQPKNVIKPTYRCRQCAKVQNDLDQMPLL